MFIAQRSPIIITIIIVIIVNIQCDHIIEARIPGIVVANKQERMCTIINIAVPADKRISEKENEKVEKYQNLKREIARMWNMITVQVVPIIVGSLGSVKKKNLNKWLGKLDIKIGISLLQKTTLLGTARILRKVLELHSKEKTLIKGPLVMRGQ